MAYTPKNWQTGEIIEAEDLNHMEQGIAAADAAATGTGTIGTQQLANGSVTTQKIAPAAVTNNKLDQEAVDSDNIRTGAIITPLIYDGAVTLPKLGADVIAELDNKADIDGSYEGMTVRNAEQLVSSVGVEDSAPYTFRTTGGSADVGDRMNLKAVVGGTVAWNQLQSFGAGTAESAGVTYTRNSDGSITCSGISTGDSYLNLGSTLTGLLNHVLYICGCPKGGSTSTYYFRDGYNGNASDRDIGNGKIIKGRSNYVGQIVFWSGVDSTGLVFRPQMFDLTVMFGSTIADYVYTLESGTAGAGIAWLKKYGYLTKPYYPYKAASLESVKTSAHRTVGFNQFDEVCESGYINISTGENDDSVLDTRYRSKNYIRVVPNTTYYYKASVSQTNNSVKARIYFYDASKSFISSALTSAVSDTFTTPSNCGFIRFFVNQALSTYNHDICINLHWDGERDGEYEPYEEHTYALDDVELRGIPKLDASNNLYYDGDRYLPDGTVIRKRRQMVADGDTVKATSVNQSGGTYYCVLTALSSANKGVNSTTTETRIITDKGYRDYAGVGVGNIYITGNGLTPVICLFDQTLITVSAVNTYLASNPITIEYELATPTAETADPYQQAQIVDDFGTEEFVDAAVEANERDVAIPVGNVTVYKANLRAKLEMAPDSPDGDGDYIVRQTNGQNAYIPLVDVKELPDMPSSDGSYTLRCTVSDGTATLSWVSA